MHPTVGEVPWSGTRPCGVVACATSPQRVPAKTVARRPSTSTTTWSSKATLTTASSPSGAHASDRCPVARTRTPRPRERASAIAWRASSTVRTVAASDGCRCTSVL